MAKVIILDAGHGGTDPGAVGNNLQEKVLTLSIIKQVNSFLSADSNYTPIMTRSTDTYMSVDARWQLGNSKNPDLFMSVHFNAGGGTGLEVYPHVPKESYHSESYKFAQSVCDNVKDLTTLRGLNGIRFCYLVNGARTFSESNDINSKGYSTYYGVVRNSKCPAVLIETAFIDTTTDIAKFNTTGKQKIIAARYYRAICEYFNTTPLYDIYGELIKDNAGAGNEGDTSTDKLYRIQVGAFSKYENATNYVKEVKKLGLDAFVTNPTTDKLYRVQIGAFSVKANAEAFIKTVKAKGLDAFIV